MIRACNEILPKAKYQEVKEGYFKNQSRVADTTSLEGKIIVRSG